jgi:hypothetical protein
VSWATPSTESYTCGTVGLCAGSQSKKSDHPNAVNSISRELICRLKKNI